MKSLTELVKAVEENVLYHVPAFNLNNLNEEDNLYTRLYKGILQEDITTDEEAAMFLYGTPTMEPRYRVLKKRFRERLYNSMLFLTDGRRGRHSYHSTHQALSKKLLVARFMIGISLKTAGYELLAEVLKTATIYQFYDIMMQCAQSFRRHALMEGNLREFHQYDDLFNESLEKYRAEATAEGANYAIAIYFTKTQGQGKELLDLAKTSLEKVEMLHRAHPTYLINYYLHKTATLYSQLAQQHQKALESCNQFEGYLQENKQFYSKVTHANILVTKVSCYLHMGRYELGIAEARKALSFYAEGSENWFILQELHFLLLLNNNMLAEATGVYVAVTSHERFSYNRPQQLEMWRVLGGYLWFMLKYHGIDDLLARLQGQEGNFRISRLLNDIPIFARDKKGMNVAVLILQILICLLNGDYASIISRNEALRNYSYRNLNRDGERSHYFIKMLIGLEKAQFHPTAVQKKTKSNYAKLQASNVDFAATHARMEIIPYERLWNIILDMLKQGMPRMAA